MKTPFDQNIHVAQQRLTELVNQLNGTAGAADDLLVAAVNELSALLQDLQVTSKELQQQNAELRATRLALEEERARYRTVSELISDYAYAIRLEPDGMGKLEWVTDAFTTITGLEPDEVYGYEGWLTAIHPEDQTTFEAGIQALLTGQTSVCEYRVLTKDKRVRWLRDYARPEWDEEAGRAVRIYGTAQDITGQRQAEEALRVSEARNRALLAAIPDAIMRIHRDGTMLDMKEPTNYTPVMPADQMIGKNQYDLLPHDLAQQIMYYVTQSLQSGELQSFEYFIRIGEEIHMREARVTPTAPDEVVAIIRDITERRETREVLRQSEAFCQSVLDSLSAHIAVLDEAGTIVAVNQAWERFAYGNGSQSPVSTGIGANYLAVCERAAGEGADEALAAITGIRAVMDGQMSQFSLEYPCHSPTTKRWFILNVVPLVGDVGVAVVSHINITERELAEEALRSSEAHNRALLAAIPDAMAHVHRDGTILSIKTAADYLVVETTSPVIGKNLRDILPSAIYRDLNERNHMALATGTLQTLEYEVEIAGGKRVRESRAMPVNKDEVITIVRDITERKQQEEALRRSEARNRALLEAIPDAILRIDRNGIYVDVKAPLEFTSSTPAEQMIGKHQGDVLPADIAHKVLCYNERALETGATQTFEYEIEKENEIHARESRVVPSGDDEVTVIVRDVTERTRAQAEERRLLAEVQSQSEELRALHQRLAEIQESERQQLARELHDQVGQNLSTLGLSLNIIQTKLLTELPQADQLQTLLSDSREMVKQTTERVRNVMAELRPPMLDDYGLPATLAWYAERLGKRVGFRVDVDAQEPIPRLSEAVENALFRITQEAMTNIMKHAQATQVDIQLRADDHAICLTIRDNGQGFDPILPADASARTSWGLLSMRERAEAIGGRFTIDSQKGSGTTIQIEIEE